MLLIPEQKVKSIIDYCLNFISSEYTSAVDKSKTYLHLLFGGYSNSQPFDYYKNAIALITRPETDPRCIETHFFLNRERFNVPTVHVTLNSDTPGPDGIGYDPNWENNMYQGSDVMQYQPTAGREFNTRFQIVITSDSTFDVLIIYHTLMAALIGNNHLLSLNGIQNPSLKGGDIILNDGISPNVYARAIMIDCHYSMISPSFQSEDLVSSIQFRGEIESGDNQDNIPNPLKGVIPDVYGNK